MCLAISLCNQAIAEEFNRFDSFVESGYGHDPNHIETAAWIVINSENDYEFFKWPHSGEKNKETWKGQIPKNLVAQVHTHSGVVDPKPSQMDRQCAVQIKAPVYIISKAGIWKVNQDGKVTQEATKDWWLLLEKNAEKN